MKPYEERPSHLQPEQSEAPIQHQQISHEGTPVQDTDVCSSDDSDEDGTDDEQGNTVGRPIIAGCGGHRNDLASINHRYAD